METMLSKHSYFGKSAPLFLTGADSFRVRDSHPIPLFSEQAYVSKRFLRAFRLACPAPGRACATKAMVFSFVYAYLIFARKKTSLNSAKR